ncbi:hypothetical protein ACPPVU_22805 [Mucilaginibacter sp. McL0603]|uniref:hypothetical protein n=1 Tax=Mucilaginibacter sp. McL0603 TaxID=3415670 RepID=UPI003CEA2EF2
MRYFVFILTLIFTIYGCRNQSGISKSEKNKSQYKVDSVFKKSFLDLNYTLKSKKVMTRDEITFIYLSTYLSGIQIDVQSYSGVPELDSKKLIEFESWYKENKDRIIWDRVKKGLEILRSTQIDQKQIKELESLKIN